MNKNQLGSWGEQQACKYLTNKGFKVLHTNYKCGKFGEVDIIAKDISANLIAFVEVKTRSSNNFMEVFEVIDKRKKQALINAAKYYSLINKVKGSIRIDLITINTKNNITEHFEDILQD